MFDLIDECGQDLKVFGYKEKKLDKFLTSECFLKIDSNSKSQKLGMKKGEYYILNSPHLYDFGIECYIFTVQRIVKQLKKLFKEIGVRKNSKILIVGLGNPDIVSDRLGKEVFDKIEINALSKSNKIFKFCPNIYFSTGINTTDMIKMFVRNLRVDFCIIVDSLTTSQISRLGTSFQITSSGITPGSGVNRFGSAINFDSIKVKCLSIGVPFMIYASSFDKNSNILLAPKDIKENIADAGFIIAKALNEVLK
jgi:spore protease